MIIPSNYIGLDRYFLGSGDEMHYGNVRLQPLAFQDDIARMARNVNEAVVGNIKMDSMMKEKQLEVHPDKTGYIVLGSRTFKESVERASSETPIMFGNIVTQSKTMDKYLGDMIHMDGLSASINATIDDRAGKIKASMYEVAAIVEDFRMQAVGGLRSAWDLWNLAIVPSLLSNCGVWTEMEEKSMDRLEEMQNSFIRRVLQVPVSTPKVSLRPETGLLSMKLRIWKEKIRMVLAIKEMDSRFLARQIYEEQKRNDWPGLAKEVEELCGIVGLPNANRVDVTKMQVDGAIREHNRLVIRSDMILKYKKLDDLVEEEDGMLKDYMRTKNISESRVLFRIRTKMLDLKDNMKGRYSKDDLNCSACNEDNIESQAYVLSC